VSASPVHGAYCYEKEYKVLVARQPDERQLTAWRNGVVLEDGYRTQPAKVWMAGTYGKGAWLKVILKEGRKRQIREMGKLTGSSVVRIRRVRIGNFWLGKLKLGQWRHLTPDEVRALKEKPAASKKSTTPHKKK
jgi:23S rRNA pseudouridine2605 synthase